MKQVQTTQDFLKNFTAGSAPVEAAKSEDQAAPAVEGIDKVESQFNDDFEIDKEENDEFEETIDAEAPIKEDSQEESEEEEEASDKAGADDEESDGIVFEDDVTIEEPDYAFLGKELGFEEVKNKEQFLERYKKDVSKAKEDALEGIPDALKQAVSFAKEGGDYMALIDATSIDYDKVSNRELVESVNAKYFQDEDGNFDKEAFNDWLDSEGKAKTSMMADQIRGELKRDQSSKVNAIRDRAFKEKEKMNAELKVELDKIDAIGGVKLSSVQKETMYRDTVSGQAMEEMFYENGKISNKKLVPLEYGFGAKFGIFS